MCVDEHLSLSKLHRYWRPSPPTQLSSPLAQRLPATQLRLAGSLVWRAPLIHVVRELLEACVSAYQYHLTSTESYARACREDLLRRGPTSGMAWQPALRSLDRRSGVLLECRRSVRDQISQQAEAFNETRSDSRVLTVRMEETERDFDGTMSTIFQFLGASAHWPALTQPLHPAAQHLAPSPQALFRVVHQEAPQSFVGSASALLEA